MSEFAVEADSSKSKPSGDIFAKCYSQSGNFGYLRAAGDSFFTRATLEGLPGARTIFAGRECVMWSTNDYLGLVNHPELLEVAAATAKAWGAGGPMGSRMMSGSTPEHNALEADLARFCGRQDACLFPYGYMGVLGTIQALTGPDDVLIMDKMAHASIVDAAKLSTMHPRNLRVFRHNDLAGLERLLRATRARETGGVLILVEGVYGMTGDCAPLAEISFLKERYGARLFVDDAHGFGIVGPNGLGAPALAGVAKAADVYFSTFAKSFAWIGGFSAADHEIVEWIRYNARTHLFARGLPMAHVKTLQATLEIVETTGEERRQLMWQRSRALSEGLRALGYYVRDVPSPLVPVLLPTDNPRDVMVWTAFLRNHGVFVSPVAYPVIPRGAALFRMVPTANHRPEDVSETLVAFEALRDEHRLRLLPEPAVVRAVYGSA